MKKRRGKGKRNLGAVSFRDIECINCGNRISKADENCPKCKYENDEYCPKFNRYKKIIDV